MISYKKNGGLHFLRIGRLNINFSLKKADKKEIKKPKILTPMHKQIAIEQMTKKGESRLFKMIAQVVTNFEQNRFVFG